MILSDRLTDKTVIYGGVYTLEVRRGQVGRWDLYNQAHPMVPVMTGFPTRRKAIRAAAQIIKGGSI